MYLVGNSLQVGKFAKLSLVLFCAVLLVLIYIPGISGALYYDDYSNLEGLASIQSWGEAWSFVSGGHAGPLGRPIALLSFVPFASGWPENSQGILFFNVVVHCFNFLLFFLIGRECLALIGNVERRLHFRVALMSALMWAVLPILASASLIAIQRMTGLATLFGLMGLLGFIKGYAWAVRGPLFGTLAQLSVLGLGTLLSIYTKESGALFPVFALLIDFFVVRLKGERDGWPWLRRLVLCAPLLFVLFYISPIRFDWFAVNSYRGFSPADRVVTEWVVLWEYLYRGFFPQSPTAYGPFHDYYGLKTLDLGVIAAGMSWLAVLLFAFAYRSRYKFFSFAVLWFVAGHLIESTSLMLELYFEHRNYVAMYGICLFLTVAAFTAKGKIARVAPWLLGAYIVLLAAVLLAITSLWGQPQEAADTWNKRHPGSARAALHAVFLEQSKDDLAALGEQNSEYISRERMAFALKVLDRTKQACPDCLDIRLQGVMYSCVISDGHDTASRMREAISVAETGRINVTVVDQLFNLHTLLSANQCGSLGFSDLLSLIELLEQSSKMNVAVYGAKIYFVKAMIEQELGQVDMVWRSLSQAENIAPDAVPVLQYQVYFALEQGDISRAEQAIARRENDAQVASTLPAELLSAMKQAIAEARE
ncbi:hypothetical protein SAMN05216271_1585 [Halopseudomonas sabulinigri]|uniref:Tetratricopeptide repeat protein n=1 Tax=Halopseudomonas sabulinigri TaxID=472181 RepID=A0A1H1QYW1_9GAMM|nr:hypothetical protein SAMN05216271_1585 [Halopseudomonas sabulinigri]